MTIAPPQAALTTGNLPADTPPLQAGVQADFPSTRNEEACETLSAQFLQAASQDQKKTWPATVNAHKMHAAACGASPSRTLKADGHLVR